VDRYDEPSIGLDIGALAIQIARMATKKISLRLEAYERLRRARRNPGESLSEVILRARWPGQTLTGA
jgi:hypothetical protein